MILVDVLSQKYNNEKWKKQKRKEEGEGGVQNKEKD